MSDSGERNENEAKRWGHVSGSLCLFNQQLRDSSLHFLSLMQRDDLNMYKHRYYSVCPRVRPPTSLPDCQVVCLPVYLSLMLSSHPVLILYSLSTYETIPFFYSSLKVLLVPFISFLQFLPITNDRVLFTFNDRVLSVVMAGNFLRDAGNLL